MRCDRCWSEDEVEEVRPPALEEGQPTSHIPLCRSCRREAPRHPILFHKLFMPFASRKELLRHYHVDRVEQALLAWSSDVGLEPPRVAALLSREPGQVFLPQIRITAQLGRRGLAPYGYRYQNGKTLPFPPEADVVKAIFKDFLRGSTIRTIAGELNLRGIPAKQGGRWHPSAVHSILRNSLYTGFLHRKGFVRRGDHRPLVDFDIYREAQFVLVRRCRVPSQKRVAYFEGP